MAVPTLQRRLPGSSQSPRTWRQRPRPWRGRRRRARRRTCQSRGRPQSGG